MILDCLLVGLVAAATSLDPLAPGAAAAPSVSDPESDSVIRSYDLGAMSGLYDVAQSIRLFPGSPTSDLELDEEVTTLESLGSDRIYELIYSLLGEEIEYEGRTIWMSNEGKLVLRAPESVQARVREILAFIADAQAARTYVLVDLVEVPKGPSNAGPMSGVVDLSQARRLLAMAERGGDAESYRVPINFAGHGRLSNATYHGFVGDYDVEVAQDSFAFDPVLMTMSSGLELELSAAPAKGGTRLSMVVSHGTPTGPIEDVELDLRGLTKNDSGGVVYDLGADRIQSCSVLQRSMALQTLLPTGKALVFHTNADLTHSGSRQLLIVRQEGRGMQAVRSSAFTEGPGEIHFVNLRAMAPYEYRISGSAMATESRSLLARQDRAHYEVDLWAELHQNELDFYHDMLGELGDEADMMWDSDDLWFLAFRGEEDEESTSRADVGALYASTADVLMADAEVLPLSISVQRSGDGGSRSLQMHLPLLVGARSAVSMGVERTVIRDYDVEIAQGSAVADPITGIELDGASLALRPHRTADGRLLLEVRGFVQLLNQDASFDPKGEALSPMDLPQYDRLVLDETLDLSEGGAVLGNANVEGRSGSVRLEVGLGQAFQINVQTR